MKQIPLCAALAVVGLAQGARAGEVVTFPFNFTFSSGGGVIADNSINVFAQDMDIPGQPSPSIPEIVSLELQIHGLQYQDWDDLDILLINPFGQAIEIMTDRGSGFSNATGPPINLTFSDLGLSPVPLNGPVSAGTFLPEGLANATDAGFGTFVGASGGTDAWILLVIDDAGNPGGGSFTQWVLSGVAVPEPATLSLLALGAVALLRRTTRRR